MQEADKKQARELLMKSKIYRMLAIVFAAVGMVVFLFLYFQLFKGDVYASLKDPLLVILIVFPFMPAIMLSLKAKKAEKALSKLLTTGQ